ncbi:2-amino-4-hydroxy-6-hydroxymethyldihydropteridine diphosphokinase [candidate division NPL-UPA2 bacterium]|nr:2-amino-4-hydroxy-6-hydroxymethyldihydropteridine diphosphokinase [candidate division NPL-UPA2 bacterium]
MTKVFLGLGSNLGDREQNIKEALKQLQGSEMARKVTISSLYETKPEGVKEQPLFLNAVLRMETGLSPRNLLDALQDLERQLGRERSRKWGPRIIDLDILLYGNLVMKEKDLEIPHPLLAERSFVLIPLAELAPETIHPILGETISALRDEKLKKTLTPGLTLE